MINEILEEATLDDLKRFIKDMMEKLENRMPDVYKDVLYDLHDNIYGCHFSKPLLDEATKDIKHWTLEQTTSVAKSNGIDFKTFNEYDFNYVMNMLYSDYNDVVPNDTSMYVRLTNAFLLDADAPKGKAVKYYFIMH